MTMDFWNWGVCQLIWKSKGHNNKEAAAKLTADLQRKGFSESSVQRNADLRLKAPADVIKIIRDLPVRPKFETTSEVVRVGLETIERGPIVDPEVLAASLSAKLPQVDPKVIAAAVTAEVVAALTQQPKPATADEISERVVAKLAQQLSQSADVEREGDRRAIIRTVWGAAAMVAGVVGIIVMIASGRAQSASNAPPATPIIALTGPGSGPLAFDARNLLGAVVVSLGEKAPSEQYIPDKPLPGQKLAQNCRATLGEEAINGGCWVNVGSVKPPCGELFRKGDICYRPVAADPNVPVGGQSH